MGGGQPGGALVVQVGQRALGKVFLEAGLGHRAVGVGRVLQPQRHHLGHGVRPLGRVQPGLAQGVEALGGLGNRGGRLAGWYGFDSCWRLMGGR